nr:alpha-hydroxy-acid oxidizing protein [Actinomycetota bacterium]
MTSPPPEIPDGLDPVVAAYVRSGGDTGLTVELNQQAWSRWSIRPRMLRDVSELDPGVTLLGRRLAHPVLVAPMSGLSLLHAGGEMACARGAAAAAAGFCLTSGSSQTVAAVAAASGPFLQQVYLWPERDQMLPFVEEVVSAGALGFLLTVDSPPQAARYGFRSRVTGMRAVASPNFEGGGPPAGSPADSGPEDIRWLTEVSGLPVLVKGVLRGDDAQVAMDAGAAGIVVSNHGGRGIDGSVTTAEALPEVAEAVAGRGLVLADGGIRQGEDVVRALALGADAVLVGRPVAWALARGGADGVAALLPGGGTRELARLLPEFGEPAGGGDAGEARARLFEQVLVLLEQLADAGPVVMVIEDAHWADRSTRDLLAFLIR